MVHWLVSTRPAPMCHLFLHRRSPVLYVDPRQNSIEILPAINNRETDKVGISAAS